MMEREFAHLRELALQFQSPLTYPPSSRPRLSATSPPALDPLRASSA